MFYKLKDGCSGSKQDWKAVISWALYDWANSAFATTVMAGFFPVFFKQYWSAGAEVTESTFYLGLINSLSSIAIFLLAPVLGAIADRGGARKRFLFFFTLIGIAMTGALYFVAKGDWPLAAALYALAAIGFSGAIIFYDALLVGVAADSRVHFISALGFAFGYLGGGLLFAVNVAMTLWPQTFGLADAGEAVRLSFISVAVWWAVFSIPLLVFVPEPGARRTIGVWSSIKGGIAQLGVTFQHLRRLRVVAVFLVGYWLYIDAVDTVVRMAVDYGMSLGFRFEGLIVALLITQFVGFPAALLFGWLGERWGPKMGIFVAIAVYIGVTVWASVMEREAEFYALAVAIGLVQGGLQSLSRSLYARIIPSDKSAEFFGFYNMLGKFAAILGPLLLGWMNLVTGSPRLSILSLIPLFALGAAVLLFVDEKQGRRMARELERL